jgi:hypothetical protein
LPSVLSIGDVSRSAVSSVTFPAPGHPGRLQAVASVRPPAARAWPSRNLPFPLPRPDLAAAGTPSPRRPASARDVPPGSKRLQPPARGVRCPPAGLLSRRCAPRDALLDTDLPGGHGRARYAPEGRLGYPALCRQDVTARGRLPERPKGAVCKTVGLAYVGSNPTPATTRNTSSEALWPPFGRRGACSQTPPDAAACRLLRDIRGMTGRPISTNRGARGFRRGDISITPPAERRLSACSPRPDRRPGSLHRREAGPRRCARHAQRPP